MSRYVVYEYTRCAMPGTRALDRALRQQLLNMLLKLQLLIRLMKQQGLLPAYNDILDSSSIVKSTSTVDKQRWLRLAAVLRDSRARVR
jgi:hypothetical protein